MNQTYSIIIINKTDGKKIGELLTASSEQIMQLINKGFGVIDRMNGAEITEGMLMSTVGVSDGFINIG